MASARFLAVFQGQSMKAELVPDNGDPPIVIDRDLTVRRGAPGFCDGSRSITPACRSGIACW